MFTPPGQDPIAVRTILFVFVLALLAQLCSRQMAHGAERFLTEDPAATGGATLQLRGDATIVGDEIKLRQVARWAEADRPTLDPLGDLVVAHFGPQTAFRDLAIDELKDLLSDAGVNVATLNFSGPMTCRANRSDADFAPGGALEQATAVADGRSAAAAAAADVPTGNIHTLRQLLITDVAERLNLPVEQLQVTFKSVDEAVLRLAEPHSTFDIKPQRCGNLGDVSWVVVADAKRYFVTASARAWQNQVVASHTLLTHQTIVDADVTERRVLIDRLGAEAMLTKDQVLGQAAATEMRAGAVFTARTVDPIQLIKAGQDVMIDTAAGLVHLKTVGHALESGTLGQTVRLRNEQTGEPFNAIVTGPQAASLVMQNLLRDVR